MSEASLVEQLAEPRGPGKELGWWGMVTLVMTEALLFGLLIFTYYWLRARTLAWPPAGIREPELLTTFIRSVLLWASSATISWGDRGIRKNQQWRLQLGLAATFVLAGVFLAGHVVETATLLREFTWRDNAYGSIFYTLTNLHAAHLIVGIAIIAFTFTAARRGAFDADHDLGVRTTSIYWHFVDVVWVAVFATVYLYPHLT